MLRACQSERIRLMEALLMMVGKRDSTADSVQLPVDMKRKKSENKSCGCTAHICFEAS